MEPGAVYRLRTATMGAVSDGVGTRPVPITIPAEAVLTVVDEDPGCTGYVRVLWEGRVVTMFSVDLRARGETAGAAGAGS